MLAEGDLTVEQEEFDSLVDNATRLWALLQESEKVPEWVVSMAKESVRGGGVVGGFDLNAPGGLREFPERFGTAYQKSAEVLELEAIQQGLQSKYQSLLDTWTED